MAVRPAQATDWQLLETRMVLLLVGVLAVMIAVLVAVILAKSVLNRRQRRREREIEGSVRQAVYSRLGEPDPDWEAVVADLSKAERAVLPGLLERGTQLIAGSTSSHLTELADEIDLVERARSAIESDDHYERLRGLQLFIEFGWAADPEWLLSAVSERHQDEGEAAIRILANDPDPVTRLTGVELAMRQSALSVWGTDALHRLVRDDPDPLLRQLDRQTVEEPELLAQLLRVLLHAETAREGAPMAGVVESIEHESPIVRGAACAVLGKYGWRSGIRDRIDLHITELFEDPSVHVRIKTYEMLAQWGDAAAKAKLARAAESETNSRAQFAILRGLGRDAEEYLGPEADGIQRDFGVWTEVSELGVDHAPQLP